MQIRIGRTRQPGLTLLEAVVVLAIIAILISLLLGPARQAYSKARYFKRQTEARQYLSIIRDQLSKHYQSRGDYPVRTAKELHRKKVFDGQTFELLRRPYVTFIPFSSTDPADKVILRISNEYAPKGKPSGAALMKKQVTR